MRYHLKHSDSEQIVTLSSQANGEAKLLSAQFHSDDENKPAEIRVLDDLVQIRQNDGSFKNLRYQKDTSDPGSVKFFHRGRVRKVYTVGGLAGNVESMQSEGAVMAPMNGQVVKVPVNVGESVSCGDIILILEAMKMENEVTAPISGTLSEISVTPGQTVSPGQALFVIEAVE